ncbi:MAG: HPr(Ser) kinase/phosphatase [Thermodesulfobacteriota bacterium]
MVPFNDTHSKPLTIDELYRCQKDSLKLRLIAGKAGLKNEITTSEIQKPGLRLTGFVFDLHADRIQVFGLSEVKYLLSLSKDELKKVIEPLQSMSLPCLIVTRGIKIPDFLVYLAEKRGIPLLKSILSTNVFIENIAKYLEERLAPTTILHGVLVDVLGIGIIIKGKSGIGKSECALDLVSKGYRLVADDVVEIKKRGPYVIFGKGSDVTKYHMEVRGLGIINIKDLFGITAIREKKMIDIVVELIPWDPKEEYDRLGLEGEIISILGIDLPLLRIPMSPGRSIATLIEVAARNQIIKIMGNDPARAFEKRLDRAILFNEQKREVAI